MGKFSDMLGRNRIYALILFVVIVLNVMVFSEIMGTKSGRTQLGSIEILSEGAEDDQPVERNKMFDPEEVKEREVRIGIIAIENPTLYFRSL